MLDKIMIFVLALGLLYSIVSLYSAKVQLDSLGNTVDEINIMLKDFNNG